MIDFEKRKEKSVLISQMRQEEALLNTEQSKFLYEITFNNKNQIKEMEKEMHILKTQMCDILNMFNDKSLLSKLKNKNNKNFLKDELEEYINKEINNQLNENFEEINNKIILFNDEFKSELDNEIEQIKNELLNHEKLLITLNNNKLDKIDFDKNINNIKHNFDKLNENIQKTNYEIKRNEDDIIKKNSNLNSIIDKSIDLKKLKKEIYSDFEKINIKILNELKNQAYDIKSLYQELQINAKNNLKNSSSINTEEDILTDNINYTKIMNIINTMEKELTKKVNLEQLNFALNAQTKLNEALNNTCKICRMCWDSEGILSKNKYIKWSSQNINTALNVFNWDNNNNNNDTIKILQKGVYKIVVGLIGLEWDKNIKVIFNNDLKYKNEIEIKDNDYNLNTEWNIGNDKGNIKFIEKYFACVENTEIKIWLIDNENYNNDISEEAFLELEKII